MNDTKGLAASLQPCLKVDEAAQILGVADSTVRSLITSGELRAFQVGQRNQWRIQPEALSEYIKHRETLAQQQISARSKA